MKPFKPLFFLNGPHAQTLGCHLISRWPNPPSETSWVTLSDGDQMTLEVSESSLKHKRTPVVVLMPGTSGSHLSSYMKRLTHKLVKRGAHVIRLNYRGVAKALGKAKRFAHAGSSQDVYEALNCIKSKYPDSPLIAAGFSLSGNTLLKCASEYSLKDHVDYLLALCPPLELGLSSEKLELHSNRAYHRSILKTIVSLVSDPKSQFECNLNDLKEAVSLKTFDEYFTAPMWGFESAEHYYTESSALKRLGSIQVPSCLLFAKDDPLIDCTGIESAVKAKHMEVILTDRGGHMGFLQNSLMHPFWMDELIVAKINQITPLAKTFPL